MSSLQSQNHQEDRKYKSATKNNSVDVLTRHKEERKWFQKNIEYDEKHNIYWNWQ